MIVRAAAKQPRVADTARFRFSWVSERARAADLPGQSWVPSGTHDQGNRDCLVSVQL